VIDILFWFLLAQGIPGFPAMTPGTEVKIVAPELLPVLASARVEVDRLVFVGPLEPGAEVRILILPPNPDDQEPAELLRDVKALYARVSNDGTDILLHLEEHDRPISFRRWLLEERGILMTIGPPADAETDGER
jgi:hypothetical protein